MCYRELIKILFQKHKTLYDDLKKVYEEQKLVEIENNVGSKSKKSEIQNLILKFVIKERLPLRNVESEHFNRLIECKH